MISILLLGIIYLAFISLGLPDSILGVAIPGMQAQWGISLSAGGLISLIAICGTVISSMSSSFVIKKLGTGRITFISCLITGSALLGFSLVPAYYWLLIIALPLGLGAGSVDAALNNYVALHFKAHHMNWLHSFWGVGATLGPLIMGSMLVNRGWQAGYKTIGLIQLSLAVLLLISLPLWKKHKPVIQDFETPVQSGTPTGSVFRRRGVKEALSIMLLYCSIETGIGLWGSSFLIHVRAYSIDSAATWMAMYYGGITIGRFLSGFISFRFTNTQMIRGGVILALFGVVLLALPLPSIVTGLILILIGLGLSPIFPAMLHETPVRFGAEASQKIIGYQMGFGYMGAAILPPLIGLIVERLGMNFFPILISLIAAVLLLLSERINRIMKLGM